MENLDYKASFEQSSAIMVMLDTSFVIVAVSNPFLKVTKTTRETIVGQDIFKVFPDNPNDLTADGESNIRASLNRVIKNKSIDSIAVVKYDIPKSELEGGGFELKYWRPCHSPVFDEFNNVKFIIQRVEDVTENEMLIERLEIEKKLLKQVVDSEKRYNMLLMKSPFAFAVLKGKKMVITLANDSIKKIWGKDGEIEGKPVFEVLPELKDTPFPGLLDDVYTTGIPFYGDEVLAQLHRENKLEDLYFNFIYQPYLEADETISGVTVIVYDVTAQVLVKKAFVKQREIEKRALKSIEESNKRYHMMLMDSPFAFSVMKGKEMVIALANDSMKEFWGKGNKVEGKTLLQVLPELENQPFPAMIIKVLTTGVPIYASEILAHLNYNGKMEDRYFNLVYQPYYEADETISGVTTIAYEVTASVIARKKTEKSREKFRLLVMQAPVAICVLRGEDYVIETINTSMLEMWDRKMEEALNKPVFDVLPEFRDQGLRERLDNVYKTGENVVVNELPLNIMRNGVLEQIYVKFVYEPLRETDGTITGVMALAHEITDQVIARKRIKAQLLRHQDMLMTAPGFVCTLVGSNHVHTLVNEQYQMLFGKREIKGKPMIVALPELEGQGFDKLLDNIYSTGETYVGFDIPITLARDENLLPELRYFNFSCQPMYDENKKIYSILVFGYEVTQQVIAMKRIEKSEKLHKQLLDSMPQIAWTNTTEGEISFFNQRWYDYTGLGIKQTSNLGCNAVIHSDDLQIALNQYHSILRTTESGEFQVRGKRHDGSYRWHLIRLMPIIKEKDEVQLWMGTATDIQELRLLQQQKDDFISIASHELKTPITTLKASIQLLNRLKGDPSNAMLPKLITQANKSLDKVVVLMEDLLNASKANEGQLHINKTLIKLSEVILECCPHVRTEGKYTIKTEGDMDLEVYADASRIDQIVVNFVNNAIKYAADSKDIYIYIEKENEMVKVSVTDKGPGIAQEKLIHLFDRYYRVDSSGIQYSGLGLGLYISAEIIKKHNGQIGVKSEVGKGSTFWFTLPIA